MTITTLIATILLIATSASPPPPAEQTASAAPSAEAEVPETPAAEGKKICRTEKATGSLTRRTRICMTAAQWREVHDRTRRGVGELQGSASGAPRCISAADVACGTT